VSSISSQIIRRGSFGIASTEPFWALVIRALNFLRNHIRYSAGSTQDKGLVSNMVNLDNSDVESPATPKRINVWVDGCYDMGHFGHANSFRQAKAMGNYLIVGVHNDAEISLHKGPPVFNERERYATIRAMKWVDEVVEAAPYVTTVDTLDKYDCTYCGHANDITLTADGKDTYQAVKDAGRYKEFERTQGVSTTDLIQRMLSIADTEPDNNGNPEYPVAYSPWTGKDPLLLSTRLISNFAKDLVDIPAGAKVVYVAGAFDVLHPGHLGFLEAARKLGDYLIVGLHDDAVVNAYKGSNYPVMKLSERYLSLLGCKYVSEVVLGAPYSITQELIDHFGVTVVAQGKTPVFEDPGTEMDPYSVPKKLGIFREVHSESTLTTEEIVQRVLDRREVYEKRNRRKEERELELIES